MTIRIIAVSLLSFVLGAGFFSMTPSAIGSVTHERHIPAQDDRTGLPTSTPHVLPQSASNKAFKEGTRSCQHAQL